MSSIFILNLARTRIFHMPRVAALGFLILYVGIALLIGFWAGRVARARGRDYAVYMAIGTIVSFCGLIPGLIVVLVAYLQGPAQGQPAQRSDVPPPGPPPGVGTSAAPPPPPGQSADRGTQNAGAVVPPPPPPVPPAPPPPDEPSGVSPEVRRKPDGGYEYTPPPPPPKP
jgi:hypothetical protein